MKNCGILQVFVLCLILVTIQTDDLCDPVNGAPSNGEYCMLIPDYDTYQRAECGQSPFTTNSSKIETCADGCRDYCWLPCMVREFDQHNGTVDPACACQGDMDQTCENVTGSVLYYTECLNKTVACPALSYIDFAVFYFTWLSEKITEETNCTNSERLNELRLCVENKFPTQLQNSQFSNYTCETQGYNFMYFFDDCTANIICPLDFYSGVLEYQRIFLNGTSPIYIPTQRC